MINSVFHLPTKVIIFHKLLSCHYLLCIYSIAADVPERGGLPHRSSLISLYLSHQQEYHHFRKCHPIPRLLTTVLRDYNLKILCSFPFSIKSTQHDDLRNIFILIKTDSFLIFHISLAVFLGGC